MRKSFLGGGPSFYKRRSAGADPFRLDAPAGPGAFNQDGDRSKVAGLLAGAGHLETLKPDRDSLIQATRRFQKDAGLKVDGLLNPDGPTIRALNRPGERAPGLTPAAQEVRSGLVKLGQEGPAPGAGVPPT